MASIKVKFRPSVIADHEGTIYYQIIHERKQRQLLTDYHVFPNEWNNKGAKVLTVSDDCRRLSVQSIGQSIRWDVERLSRIVKRLDKGDLPYTAEDVVEEFRHYISNYSLFKFMDRIIAKLKKNGKLRTAETYRSALNSFRKFLINEYSGTNHYLMHDIMIDCIDSEIMEAYEAWNVRRGVTPNTISFYNRILRAVYNRAVEDNIIDSKFPFKHLYTGVDKTVKRALPLSVIRRIRSLDLSSQPQLDYARDMFILSFMLRGMSFVDMAYLAKTDRVNGYITYRRRKTGQRLVIKWTAEMQMILDKYPERRGIYLLPIIGENCINTRSSYRNSGYRINKNLKKVAQLAKVDIPLTLYVARHSWASAAKEKGIPVSVISEGMGHDSESTTQIYLASLDTSVIDKANSIILKSL